jgi:hypothetical protein
LNAHANVDSTTTSVGGRVHLTVEVEGAENWSIVPPSPGTELGPFVIRSVTPKEGAQHPSFDLALTALKPGESEIPPLTLTAKASPDRDTTLLTQPIRVVVRSNLEPTESTSDSAQTALAADKPPFDAPRDWRPIGIAFAAVLLGALAGYYLVRRLRQLRRRPAALPPPISLPKRKLRPAWEIALEELDRIARERYVDHGKIKLQYVEVTTALRRYLEDRYGIPALESTTDELRPRLQEISLGPDGAPRVLAILKEADLVKFAKAHPEPDAARALENRAREIVLQTIPQSPVGAA